MVRHGSPGRYSGAIPARRFYIGWPARISLAICLSCGAVNPYLSEEQLAKVKAWKSKE